MSKRRMIQPMDIKIDKIEHKNDAGLLEFIEFRASLKLESAHRIGHEELELCNAELGPEIEVYLRKQVMDIIYGDVGAFVQSARQAFIRKPYSPYEETHSPDQHAGMKLLNLLLELISGRERVPVTDTPCAAMPLDMEKEQEETT
jgi:hypothetical protein